MTGMGPQGYAPFCPWVGGLLALFCLGVALRANRRRRWVDDTPTSKTTGVFIGLVEVKGTAEAETPLVSHLAERPCVYYAWSVEESWSRTVTETYTDGQGKTQTRTRTESGWTAVAHGQEQTAFYLKDDLGVVLVHPEGAKIEPATVFSQTCRRGDPLYYAKGPLNAVANSDHRRRFTETALPLHSPLYIMGHAGTGRRHCSGDRPRPQGPHVPDLLPDREADQPGFGDRVLDLGDLRACSDAGGHCGRPGRLGRRLPEDTTPYLAGVTVYLLAWALGWTWTVFNSLVGLRNRVGQAWSLVDVQVKRRHDLIPNLVAAVQGLRDYERQVQTEVATLRTQMEATPPGVAGPDYQACAKSLRAVQEKYPQLRAEDSFLRCRKTWWIRSSGSPWLAVTSTISPPTTTRGSRESPTASCGAWPASGPRPSWPPTTSSVPLSPSLWPSSNASWRGTRPRAIRWRFLQELALWLTAGACDRAATSGPGSAARPGRGSRDEQPLRRPESRVLGPG